MILPVDRTNKMPLVDEHPGDHNNTNTQVNENTEALRYTDDVPVPVTIGGINAGTQYDNARLKDVIYDLLHPAAPPPAAPTFASFAMSGQPTTVDIDTLVSGTKPFVWTTTNPGSIQGGSLVISDGATELATGLANDGAENVAITPVTLAAPGTHTWTITGTSITSVPFSRDFVITWSDSGIIRFGTSANVVLNEAQILALVGSQTAATADDTYDFAAGGYKYICYPESMAAALHFKDPNNFEMALDMAQASDDPAYSNEGPGNFNFGDGYFYAIVTVSGEPYRVYRTTNTLGGTFSITVS